MSEEDWTYLAARSDADFPNGLFRIYFRPSLNAIGRTAQDVAYLTGQVQAYADSVSATYALAQALAVPAYGVGLDALKLPRAGDLGNAAFRDWEAQHGIVTNTQNAAYQITLHDFGKLLLTTSGTNTFTLPAATDLPDGWWCQYHNISGANLTLQRSGSDTINGVAATSSVVATGSAIGRIIRRSSAIFQIG